MNVQLSSHGVGRPTVTGAGKPAFVEATGVDGARRASPGHAPRYGSSAHRGEFAARHAHLNRRVTHAQQSMRFLDQALAGMQGLKAALSSRIASQAAASAALEQRLADVREQWQRRHLATGGALGADLSFHDDGGARQDFRIRALDMDSLRNGHAEVLTIYPRGAGKLSMAVVIDGQRRSEREWTRRLDHTLAPAGIEVSLDEESQLAYRMPEHAWNELREQLMIQGGGHRFPAGRPARIEAAPTPAPLDPSTWRIGDAAEQRATLRQAVHAIDHLQLVRDGLRRVVEQASASLRQDRELDGRQAAEATSSFGAALHQSGDFQRLSTIGAILRGLSEQRVRSVAG